MKSTVQQAVRTNVAYMRELVEPIDPAKLAVMPKMEGGVALNPPAWQVSHVAVALSFIVTLLGGKHVVPETWSERYGMNSKPTDGPADYPSKEELLRVLDGSGHAVIAALDKATDEQLAAPTPIEEFRRIVPTVGDAVTFLAVGHTATHVGQLLSWLRCMGTGPRF